MDKMDTDTSDIRQVINKYFFSSVTKWGKTFEISVQ